MTILRAALPVFFVSMAAFAAPARADDIPPCAAPAGVTAVAIPGGIAPAIRLALSRDVGGIVLPGKPFDGGDVVRIGKNRRFIFVWNVGPKWIVATEHGGRGYNDPIFVYDLSPDGQTALLTATPLAVPGTVCTMATKLAGP